MPAPSVSDAVRTANAALTASLPFDDTADFEDAQRGFIGRLDPCVVTAADGRVVWDNESYRAFLEGPAPESVNPSLWRQSILNAIDGLFEVVPGIYQVRGLDLSNITFVEGDSGVLVIDPLISVETAAAALALYREHRGDRPVVGVIYTHSHVDHFGGVKGVTSQADVDAGRCPDHGAGRLHGARRRRERLRRAGHDPPRRLHVRGGAGARAATARSAPGLGQTTSTGTVSLIAPTDSITATGETRVIDGIRMEFQLTPGTEAPAEMNVLFPDHARPVHGRERDARPAQHPDHPRARWCGTRGSGRATSRESIDRFGDRTDVVFASHHWPTWGRERAIDYLALQRDLYAYLHDQTLRLLNQGLVGQEIAEVMQLPPALEQAWHARGYYGSVSHNVKAIYQRYMGWYDGNPAHLWEHPPAEKAAALRGRHGRRRRGAGRGARGLRRRATSAGRWSSSTTSSSPSRRWRPPQALQADAFEQLGFGSENGTWRVGLPRRRHRAAPGLVRDAGVDGVRRTCSPRSRRSRSSMPSPSASMGRGPGTCGCRSASPSPTPGTPIGWTCATGCSCTAPRRSTGPTWSSARPRCPPGLLAGSLEGATIEGDRSVLERLMGVLEAPDPDFAIVTP